MELSDEDAKKKVVRVRLSRRVDQAHDQDHSSQARNVQVLVGPSANYDQDRDQVCTEIGELTAQTEATMVDYDCNMGHYNGKYVKFSSDQRYLTICEAQVLVENP